jgi:hypothetical protein
MKGNIIVSVCLVVFLASLAAAGMVWYQLRGGEASALIPSNSPAPAGRSTANLLNLAVTIDEELKSEQSAIQSNLINPLRQHYATQQDRLLRVTVQPSADEEYPAAVTLRLASPAGDERDVVFGYDLSPWKPSMLDNEIAPE